VNNPANKAIKRNFAPGSEWVYFKVYAGPKTCEKVLVELVKPLLGSLSDNQWSDLWFFIRYADPYHHLRIRFHLTDKNHFQALVENFNKLSKPFLSDGLIHRIQLDTYEREIERYGASTMEYSERVFCYDSAMCLALLEVLRGDEKEEARWLSSLQAVNTLLDDFRYTDLQKLELLRKMNKHFGDEFHKNSDLAEQLSVKYRNHRSRIEAVMQGRDESVMGKYARTIIKRRSAGIGLLTSRITLYLEKEKQISMDDLLASYIHMMMNRFFRARQRTMEMVLYDFLFRTYKSALAKNKYREMQ
jgi:thiopeptide-type bacteriocin biosynthesis protein